MGVRDVICGLRNSPNNISAYQLAVGDGGRREKLFHGEKVTRLCEYELVFIFTYTSCGGRWAFGGAVRVAPVAMGIGSLCSSQAQSSSDSEIGEWERDATHVAVPGLQTP